MIIEKVKLPSNGLLGYPAEVTIRDLKGSELSAVYTSLSDASVDYVLESVIKEKDEAFDVSKLADQDKFFLLLKLRIMTLGPIIGQVINSPFSKKSQKVEVDLSKLDVIYLTQEALDKTIEVEDQNKKKFIISRRIPNKEIIEQILVVKEKHNISSYDDALLRLVSLLNPKINDKIRPVNEFVDFLANLPGQQLLNIYKFAELQFGISPVYEVECEDTKQTFLGVLAISADLFR